MQSEEDWAERLAGEDGDTDEAAKQYAYFMSKEPREELGPIEEIEDTYLGRTKVREVRIGMTRNAKDEDKKEVLAYLQPVPHIRIDKAKLIQGWYKSLHEPAGVRPRPCFSEALLTEPYGGWCSVSCQFCYINSGFRGYRGTGLVTVPLDYGGQIRQQLSKMRRGAAGYFTSFSDPFLDLEKFYHNTENAAREFAAAGLPVFFLSRLRYPDWAIELMTKNPHSYAQKSINTSNPDDWKKLSPGALGYYDHLEDIKRIKAAGVYVSIQCNPVVPGVTTHGDIYRLFKDLAEAGADHVIVKFVEAGYSWAPAMVERMKKRFGVRGEAFENLFIENIGGQRTVAEAYRIPAHEQYQKWATKFGMTYATCYEYSYKRDEDGRILDKTGESVGRRFTTASQCHGPNNPVYTRDSADEPFRPVEECPPTGCLYCASENDGKARCGDELAGEANAVRWADLKVPIGEGKARNENNSLLQLGLLRREP